MDDKKNEDLKEEIEEKEETVDNCDCCSDEDCKEKVKAESEETENNVETEENKFEKLTEELFKVKNENSKLNNEMNALKDRLVRLNAEYENFRKRTAKEKEAIYTDACADVLKEMFGVLDNLERAVAVEGSVEDLKQGVDMTVRQFHGAFEKLGVEEIDASGEFDPNFHQAVMHVQDESFGKNSIVEVFQKGYKKADKVLRFTIVKVAN
ncbi:nucleotide exchange factor GrpE [Inconstantimicrobium mannanitabidum]|uniref:Protein GrpE n=1 Tax=Inconstantimicrobium mannanitabidum TaxID=1604901 RepID=A0ACB5R8P4_9CLOT|nr:nucleotide exchange factor GrpE [Clostridium sp. TW13]GKX65568.1 protein GrpE [Clostridium sp. TW13]